ncbi:hypothetical protein FUAX_35250 [Fulvitalea axinellae]|uniref:DUF4349 domain-containing protein n=1 Tax=Fulvitalea axinellae TaxID=1182444 RepID=A0AAU9D520_9BACT|nr:hypothetical protein FUAX_35250 [Fulvitalea axinellae]
MTNNRLRLAALYLFLFGTIACGRASEQNIAETKAISISPEARSMASSEMGAEMSEETIPQAKTKRINTQKLIKTGSLKFETKDVRASSKRIHNAVTQANGYISSETSHKNDYRSSVTLTARIPSEKFDPFISQVTSGVESFDRNEIRVKDVTEEFLDLSARLKTKKALEQRYIALLDKAKTIKNILEIEREIEKLRSDIESTEGRLRYLNDRVGFSTITFEFYKRHELVAGAEPGWWSKFGESFVDGWENMLSFFLVLTQLWPFFLLALGVIFGIKKWRGKKAKA